jgi:transposase InsO family protein
MVFRFADVFRRVALQHHLAHVEAWQNGVDESFNGKFRDECLNMERSRSRAEAVVVIQTRRRHYNEFRPHSSLGFLTPYEFRKSTEKSHHREGLALQ